MILRANLTGEGGRNFWGSKPFTEELFFCFDEKQKQNIVSEFFAKRSMSYSMDDNHYVCTVFEFRHGSKRWYWQIPLFWRTKRCGTQHGCLGFPKNHRSSFVAAAIDVTRTGASSKSVIGDKLISSRAPDFCNLLIFPISHRPEPTISDIKGGCTKHCSL